MTQPRIERRTVLRAGFGLTTVAVLGLTACSDDGDDAQSDGGSGAAPIPEPAGFVRTSWSTDPWALGSYSYLPVGASPATRAALAQPIDGWLAFAGEALDPDHPATVHGARASGTAAAEALSAQTEGPERFVIVGAGIAGAAAAAVLLEAGHDVVVLEARDRTGGRIHTERPDGWPVPVELGASWVHDTSASNLAADLTALDIATVAFGYDDLVLDADGEVGDPRLLDDPLEAIDEAVAWAEVADDDLSLADALDRSGAADDVDPALLDHALRTEITTEYGADAADLSAWWTFEEGSEGDDLLVTGGYGGLVDHLLDGVDVRLAHPVVAIARDGGTAAVTTLSQRFEADRVLVTIPIGVLREDDITFDPPLPATHRAAIDALAMGVLDKVWLRWDERWWTETAQQWTRVAEADDPYVEWFNVAAVTGEPVLLGLVGGAEARTWANATDDEVRAAALRSLQQFRDAGW